MLNELIVSLKDEFRFMDEGDLESFLGVIFKKHSYSKLKLTQPYLTQRINDTLGS